MDQKSDIMDQKTYLDGLLLLCVFQRERFGINPKQPFRTRDCEVLPCKTGCPVKKQPQILTLREMRE